MESVRGKHIGVRETSVDFVVCLLCGRPPSDPKLLSCLHTFCATCLRQRAGDTGISCPTCQERTPLEFPAGGVAALPTDFLAVNFQELERLRRGEQEMTCDTCGGGEDADEATHRCVDCQIFLCEVHVIAHRKAKKTSNHELQSAADIRKQNASVPNSTASDLAVVRRPLTCHVRGHEEKQLELFCADCCQLVCRDCILVEHREHKYSFVHDAGKGQRQHVAGRLKVIKETSARMCKVKRAVHSRQEELSKCVEDLTNKIRQTADMHRKRIDQREKVLLERLGELCRPKARILDDQSDRLTRLEKSLNHCAGIVLRVLELGSDEELITVKPSLVRRMMSLTQAGREESTYPLDDGTLKFSFSKDCLRAIDELGVMYTKPCAWTSQLTTPRTILLSQPIRSTIVFRNSLSEYCTPTSSNHQPWADLQITTQQAGNHLLKSTSHCVSCTESGECTILTNLQHVRCQGRVILLTASLHQRHLVGSPVSVLVLDPPWNLDPDHTIPDKCRVDHFLALSNELSFTVGIPKAEQFDAVDSRALWDGSGLAKGAYLHVMANKALNASSPAECLRWHVRFKKPTAVTASAETVNLWAVGVMTDRNVQKLLHQERSGVAIAECGPRTHPRFPGATARCGHPLMKRGSLIPTHKGAKIRLHAQKQGHFGVRATGEMVGCRDNIHNSYPPSSLQHMKEYHYVRSDGLASKSAWHYTDSTQTASTRPAQAPEKMMWSSEDTLQLELLPANLTLTITNLSTNSTATVRHVQLPCRPLFSVPIEDEDTEVTVEFPS